jgi:hypothetical protein
MISSKSLLGVFGIQALLSSNTPLLARTYRNLTFNKPLGAKIIETDHPDKKKYPNQK